MAKEAYYFSHDSNARTDPKILQMRSVYGYEGYGWYWTLIEIMREQENYKLDMQGKYVWNAFALELDTTAEKVNAFVEDCISEFKLFASDGQSFWSESFLERMKIKDEKSEKARKSAEARWGKTRENNGSVQSQSESNANASKSDAIKESKVKEKKYIYNIDRINEVWDYYCEKLKELGKARKKTDNKIKHINARLEENFSVEQLKTVINNVFSNEFMLGENENKKMYIEIDNFMCNTEKIEKWLEIVKPKEISPKPKEDIKCSFCRGKGVIKDLISKQWVDCPKCNGTGKEVKEVEEVG